MRRTVNFALLIFAFILTLPLATLPQPVSPPGFIPRIAFAKLPSKPAAGTVRFVTDTDGTGCNDDGATQILCVWDGSNWVVATVLITSGANVWTNSQTFEGAVVMVDATPISGIAKHTSSAGSLGAAGCTGYNHFHTNTATDKLEYCPDGAGGNPVELNLSVIDAIGGDVGSGTCTSANCTVNHVTGAGLTTTITGTTPTFTATTTLDSATSVIDIVQFSNLTIASTDTDSLVFAFVPSKIVLNSNGIGRHDTTNEHGQSTCLAILTVTGTDTITTNTNCSALIENGPAETTGMAFVTIQNGTTNAIVISGGYDLTDVCTMVAAPTWTTSTKTLLLTWTVTDCASTAGVTYAHGVATAYK